MRRVQVKAHTSLHICVVSQSIRCTKEVDVDKGSYLKIASKDSWALSFQE